MRCFHPSSILAVLLFLNLSAQAVGKELSVEQLRTLQTSMKSYDSLSVEFVQTKFSGLRGKNTVRRGKALFAKPNLFKWMLETPQKEYKIYDGKAFYDYSPETNSAKKYAPSGPQSAELRQVIDLVLNFDSLLKRYDVLHADESGDLITIKLKPKTAGDVVGIELRFAKKEQFVAFLKMDLRSKNTLTHEFKNPSRAAIAETEFSLPKGVQSSDSN